MKKIMNQKKSRWLLLTIFALLAGMPARGQVTDDFSTYTAPSNGSKELGENWVIIGNDGSYSSFGSSNDYVYYNDAYGDAYIAGNYASNYNYNNFVVLKKQVTGTVTFKVTNGNSSALAVYVSKAKVSGNTFELTGTAQMYAVPSKTTSQKEYTYDAGDTPTYIAFCLAGGSKYLKLWSVTYTEYVQAGPSLEVKDGSTKLTSPYNYNFGLATAGTTKTFALSNPGTADLGVSVSETGNFGATLSASTITAGGEATLTLTMPDASGNSAVTITPDATSGIDPFVINVSGTIRDANKFYVDDFSSLPEDWTTTGTWSYSSSNGAYTTVWYLTNEARLITPLLTVSDGETFLVEAKGYSTSNTSYQHIQMQYSVNGTTWVDFDTQRAPDPSNWKTFAFTGVPAGQYYIAINASQADIRMFYGGVLPDAPKMVVTMTDNPDYGIITAATQKTFTIANTGKATLEGINVTSSNPLFTVSDAPTSLAAGASQEVTITMAATTAGAHSSDITVSATGMTDQVFSVTGVVLPDGMFVVDFNDNQLPAGWTNASWTFANGEATGKSSSAYLTTPTLQFSDGDMLVIKLRNYDSDNTNYITVQGSTDNGSTWTGYNNKIMSSSFHSNTEWTTIVLTDIPSNVNKLRFVGFYVVVDEIAGLTYAPVLSVTLGSLVASSPENFNFGDCTANASVPYTFTNVGAGTIDITNVAITGDGAASYSTNWTTSVATPFDLVITRTYDATKAGTAQNAVVTVTTSVGDFIINVTGTDKAADAPELAVSTNAIDFGKVAADAVETVTVTNNGTGLLEVIIASDSEDFVVSTAALENIAPGESKTFTVTFKFGTPYGVKNGNVTVTPTYDATAAQTITLTGKAADPNVWSEDFSGNALPTGWEAGANWSFTNGVAKAAYGGSSTGYKYYLTTPTLTVSDATDELTFDYEATGNYVSIKIQMSQNGGAFADYKTISNLNNGNAGTYTITGLEAGDYQFRFANDDYELDNFEGFKLNLADHIASISAYTIPASSSYSMTMKEGQSFDATVTVKELRGVAEALTAKLYMGTEVIGTQTGSVAANGTETLTITCIPTTGAPSGAEMHIEVEYAGGTLSTETVTRYVAAITYLTLDETSTDPVVAGTYDNVTLKRKFNADWNTVCLPFTISDVEAFFGAGAKAYNFSGYSSEGTLSFSVVTELTASYPYIVYVPAAITDDIALTNITIASSDASAFYRYQSGAYFRGTYAPMAAGTMTGKYGVTPAGKIAKAGANASIKGFRAYFDLPAGASPVKGISFDDDTTWIDGVAVEGMEDGVLYDLSGRRVNPAQTQLRGTYILNGKKVMFK